MWINVTREELEFLQQRFGGSLDQPGRSIESKIEQTLSADDLADAPWVEKARELYGDEGQVEVDEGALVSRGEDPGAYVMAWVWVTNEDMGIEDEEENLDEPPCRDCGKPYDGYGDGYNGRCPSCADKAEQEGRADE